MELGKLAADHYPARLRQYLGKGQERLLDAVRRLVEDDRTSLRCYLLEERLPALLVREESEEAELARIHAGDGERGGERRRAGYRLYLDLCPEPLAHHSDKLGARVAYARGAGVGNERDALALGKQGEDALALLLHIDSVIDKERLRYLEAREELRGNARILAGDSVGILEGLQGTQRDIAQVADGRCDH